MNNTPLYELLDRIRSIVDAYELTNEGVLTDEDIYEIRMAQTTLTILKSRSDEIEELLES